MIDRASKDKIYIGNSERGYEIRVYDLEGNLLRDNYYFTKNWPPFRYLFTDDEGRIFVLTYEEGVNSREYMNDIFNSEGVFIGRVSLGNVGRFYPLTVRVKKNRLYCLREKESGYKELVVYKMNWE